MSEIQINDHPGVLNFSQTLPGSISHRLRWKGNKSKYSIFFSIFKLSLFLSERPSSMRGGWSLEKLCSDVVSALERHTGQRHTYTGHRPRLCWQTLQRNWSLWKFEWEISVKITEAERQNWVECKAAVTNLWARITFVLLEEEQKNMFFLPKKKVDPDYPTHNISRTFHRKLESLCSIWASIFTDVRFNESKIL